MAGTMRNWEGGRQREMSKHPGVCPIEILAKKKKKTQNETKHRFANCEKKHVLNKHLSSLAHQNERRKKLTAALEAGVPCSGNWASQWVHKQAERQHCPTVAKQLFFILISLNKSGFHPPLQSDTEEVFKLSKHQADVSIPREGLIS